ncbi:ABC transporter substrate-binding protein [Pseudodesulfovibrio sp. zrk46]|uniref:substrate-binding periplasmic protein n=1 Tax=Pseudodesulfovibrio sp. zrk46 TaxID=2725288 RepID=UPI001449E30F|nr:ABC transporter substrate-binding protein [Pseudodesulfovibrio sp. zrk46]QJB55427.1 ABC transporter substrate-binding protein [Pseudodesulfovibrio sp. zrk46]
MSFIVRLAILVFAIILPLGAQAGEFKVWTNNLPPVKDVKDGLPSGIIGDVLIEIMADNGIHFETGDAQLFPLKDAILLATETPGGIILGTMRTTERDSMFKWIGPIYTSTMGFLAAKSSNIELNSVSDANQYRVGTIVNSGSEKVAHMQKLDLEKAFRLTDNINAIDLLVGGEIDLLVFPKSSAFYLMLEENVNPNDFEMVL